MLSGLRPLLGDMEHFDVLWDNEVCMDWVRGGKMTAGISPGLDEERSEEETALSVVAPYLRMHCFCAGPLLLSSPYIHILHWPSLFRSLK